MKSVLYVVHIPTIVVGILVGTLWTGMVRGYELAMEFWAD